MGKLSSEIKNWGCIHVVFSILFIFSPGFFIASLANLLLPLTTAALWGVCIAGSLITWITCGWLTSWKSIFTTYLWTAFTTTICLLLLSLLLGQDNFVLRALRIAVGTEDGSETTQVVRPIPAFPNSMTDWNARWPKTTS